VPRQPSFEPSPTGGSTTRTWLDDKNLVSVDIA